MLKNLRHNFTVNVLDGAFFGLGMGFASSVTVVPLFVDSLTDTTALVGLVASIHLIGWQLPQILTAGYVAGLRRYLPMVIWMTSHERWPFFALALLALAVPMVSPTIALIFTFILLSIQALGGGLTATAWQSMIGKIMPPNRRGTFWGVQASAANLMTAATTFGAGIILTQFAYPYNFALCFFLASVAMAISMGFLAATREDPHELPEEAVENKQLSWQRFKRILTHDENLRMFVLARMCGQFGVMAIAFYTVYGVHRFGMTGATAGVMAALLTLMTTLSNPLMGMIGDSISNRKIFAFGMLTMALSAFSAFTAPSLVWLYVAFALAGIAQATIWTVAMTMTLEFGTIEDRPYYIGLTNTLVAPATIIAPLIGGGLADAMGFQATFGLAGVAAVVSSMVLLFIVREPRKTQPTNIPAPMVAG